jgi:hypothetical protein
MSDAKIRKNWLRLSKWGAVVLGFGTLFAGDARADKSALQPLSTTLGPSNRLDLDADEVLIRTEGERVYISQRGSAFEELSLGNTPEAAYFRKLLRDAEAANGQISIPTGSFIVANGGSNVDGAKPKHAKKKSGHKPVPPNDPGK